MSQKTFTAINMTLWTGSQRLSINQPNPWTLQFITMIIVKIARKKTTYGDHTAGGPEDYIGSSMGGARKGSGNISGIHRFFVETASRRVSAEGIYTALA